MNLLVPPVIGRRPLLLLLASTLILLSAVEARELSLYRVDGDGKTKTITTLKRRAVVNMGQTAADEENRTGNSITTATVLATVETDTRIVQNERENIEQSYDMSEDSRMLGEAKNELEEEERLHRERREMFFRNLQLDGGNASFLSIDIGAANPPELPVPSIGSLSMGTDLSMSMVTLIESNQQGILSGDTRSGDQEEIVAESSAEDSLLHLLALRNKARAYAQQGNIVTGEIRSGTESRAEEPLIDLLALRKQSDAYAHEQRSVVTIETKSRVQEEDSNIDLMDLRDKAAQFSEQQRAIAPQTYLRNANTKSSKQG